VAEKKTKKRMTKKELEEWEALYEYVRRNIMGYDEFQSLSTQMVLRLKGLQVNKFMANNNIKDTANYSYDVILNTFKYCMPEIKKGLSNNRFADESHKFNYILKIVEPKINDVYMRMKNNKKSEEKIEEIDTSIATYVGTEYKPKEKTRKIFEDEFADLW
jgi:hypothetical protein